MGQLLLWGSFLLIGFALVLLVEGLIYAVAPNMMKRLLTQMNVVPEATLRSGGVIAAVAGFGLLVILKVVQL
ncbi:MAG: DUF2065 domain-containing protein [Rhodospirillaceae bacterium]|jgi:uncharacterized protein|nr:DUF2065 domain-containing protein [Rhodospirillaceae bacterium]MBT6403443.1 DUF2065 domain-containing protein [Rhodospirillaceae bacterium]MBT6536686.1 DUF2065 domain-containing protein [Rhodospirillaceae bacterium]MBT7361063.1 DUF2065 domain-containing protein [Rhodospirillaceae bacterium]